MDQEPIFSIITAGGWPAIGLLLLLGAGMTQPWRWLGIYLANRADLDGSFIRWTRAVATAIVAALVARLTLAPGGALADVPLVLRLLSLLFGVAAFYATGKHLLIGVSAGALFCMGSAFFL